MYYIYAIRSLTYGNRYIGSTDDIDRRVSEHNRGKCRYTKGRMPWKLVYKEVYESRSEVVKREKFLKSGKGREFLDKMLA